MNLLSRHPMMTAERAFHVEACCAWIDQKLGDNDRMLPRYVAQNMLATLSNLDIATVTSTPEELRITMYGISATASSSPAAVLREWQAQAKDRLAAGWQQ